MRVNFGKVKNKRDDGFINEDTIAYVNVTSIAKNILDNVKRAILVLGTYYDSESFEEWKKRKKMEAAKIDSIYKGILVDSTDLFVEFTSGKVASFSALMWGRLTAKSKMPEIE